MNKMNDGLYLFYSKWVPVHVIVVWNEQEYVPAASYEIPEWYYLNERAQRNLYPFLLLEEE